MKTNQLKLNLMETKNEKSNFYKTQLKYEEFLKSRTLKYINLSAPRLRKYSKKWLKRIPTTENWFARFAKIVQKLLRTNLK